MRTPSKKKPAQSAASSAPDKPMLWAVAGTCAAVLIVLMKLARDILTQIQAQGGTGGAGTLRLLTGLFVVMCLAGFVAAGLWKVGRALLGRKQSEQ